MKTDLFPDPVIEDGQIKWGPKKRHVPIPDGWLIVKKTKCMHNDKFFNLAYGNWETVDADDIGMDCEDFFCLIRQAGQTRNN